MTPIVDSTAYHSWYNAATWDSVGGAKRVFDAHDIFGTLSVKSGFDAPIIATQSAIDWQGSVVVVVVLLLYCYLLFRYRAEIRVSFKSAFSLEDTLFIFESLTLNFAHFLVITRIMLSLSLAIILCIFIGVWQTLWVVGAMGVAIWLILELSALARRILQGFDYNPDRWNSIKSITRLDHAIAAIILPPVAIMLCSLPQYGWMAAGVLILLTIYHFLRLLRYFRLSGFSILQWILYLCAVETTPFTLLLGVGKWMDLLN